MFAKMSVLLALGLFGAQPVPHGQIDKFNAALPVRVHHHNLSGPTGLTPAQVRAAYHLGSATGHGTIAIVDAYDNPNAARDLDTFSSTYGLPQCGLSGACFEKHKMSGNVRSDPGWALEESLDVEWAHAIAPGAKILLVEAGSSGGSNLLSAVNYARNRSDVVAVSMSWGGGEFNGENSYDSYFTSSHGVSFFASSGDNGTGASWPAVSPNIVAVGGTTLNMTGTTVQSETAWSGSGGGISAYEPEPAYQIAVGLTGTGGKRAVPDVSYDANPSTGFPVYDSTRYSRAVGWWQVGGTSAGAPQWAAIQALGASVTSSNLYSDGAKANSASYLRDIFSGTNGTCGPVCTTHAGYDFVTGLGSPVTTAF